MAVFTAIIAVYKILQFSEIEQKWSISCQISVFDRLKFAWYNYSVKVGLVSG